MGSLLPILAGAARGVGTFFQTKQQQEELLRQRRFEKEDRRRQKEAHYAGLYKRYLESPPDEATAIKSLLDQAAKDLGITLPADLKAGGQWEAAETKKGFEALMEIRDKDFSASPDVYVKVARLYNRLYAPYTGVPVSEEWSPPRPKPVAEKPAELDELLRSGVPWAGASQLVGQTPTQQRDFLSELVQDPNRVTRFLPPKQVMEQGPGLMAGQALAEPGLPTIPRSALAEFQPVPKPKATASGVASWLGRLSALYKQAMSASTSPQVYEDLKRQRLALNESLPPELRGLYQIPDTKPATLPRFEGYGVLNNLESQMLRILDAQAQATSDRDEGRYWQLEAEKRQVLQNIAAVQEAMFGGATTPAETPTIKPAPVEGLPKVAGLPGLPGLGPPPGEPGPKWREPGLPTTTTPRKADGMPPPSERAKLELEAKRLNIEHTGVSNERLRQLIRETERKAKPKPPRAELEAKKLQGAMLKSAQDWGFLPVAIEYGPQRIRAFLADERNFKRDEDGNVVGVSAKGKSRRSQINKSEYERNVGKKKPGIDKESAIDRAYVLRMAKRYKGKSADWIITEIIGKRHKHTQWDYGTVKALIEGKR